MYQKEIYSIQRYNKYGVTKFNMGLYEDSNYIDAVSCLFEERKRMKDDEYITIKRNADGCIMYDTRHDAYLQGFEELSTEDYAAGIRPYYPESKAPSVYIDVDGTAAYWHSDGKGLSYPEGILDPKNHYYRDLEPHQFIIDLAKELHDKGYDVCVLSATDRCCVADRWEWIEKNMPFIPHENVFMCPIGADKTQFCKGNADISVLIDDYEKNLKEWTGRAVKSINRINSESERFPNIFTSRIEDEPRPIGAYSKFINQAVDIIKNQLDIASKTLNDKNNLKQDLFGKRENIERS